MAALNSTKIPKVELIIGESGKEEDFDVCGDISEANSILIKSLPILITVFKVLLLITMIIIIIIILF